MQSPKGFTTVELVISIALFSIMLGVLWFMVLSYSGSAQDEDEESQYWRKLAVLQARLRSDIRSAASVSQPIEGVIEIERLHLNTSTIEPETITWWLHEDFQSITRYGREEVTYNFSGLLGDEPLTLQLGE